MLIFGKIPKEFQWLPNCVHLLNTLSRAPVSSALKTSTGETVSVEHYGHTKHSKLVLSCVCLSIAK